MTLREAQTIARNLGCTLRHTPEGEYRVTLAGLSPERAEAVAYYAPDLADAIATARAMTAHPVERELAAAGIVEPVNVPGLSGDGIAVFRFR